MLFTNEQKYGIKNCNKIRFDSMCLKTEIEEAFDGIFNRKINCFK